MSAEISSRLNVTEVNRNPGDDQITLCPTSMKLYRQKSCVIVVIFWFRAACLIRSSDLFVPSCTGTAASWAGVRPSRLMCGRTWFEKGSKRSKK